MVPKKSSQCEVEPSPNATKLPEKRSRLRSNIEETIDNGLVISVPYSDGIYRGVLTADPNAPSSKLQFENLKGAERKEKINGNQSQVKTNDDQQEEKRNGVRRLKRKNTDRLKEKFMNTTSLEPRQFSLRRTIKRPEWYGNYSESPLFQWRKKIRSHAEKIKNSHSGLTKPCVVTIHDNCKKQPENEKVEEQQKEVSDSKLRKSFITVPDNGKKQPENEKVEEMQKEVSGLKKPCITLPDNCKKQPENEKVEEMQKVSGSKSKKPFITVPENEKVEEMQKVSGTKSTKERRAKRAAVEEKKVSRGKRTSQKFQVDEVSGSAMESTNRRIPSNSQPLNCDAQSNDSKNASKSVGANKHTYRECDSTTQEDTPDTIVTNNPLPVENKVPHRKKSKDKIDEKEKNVSNTSSVTQSFRDKLHKKIEELKHKLASEPADNEKECESQKKTSNEEIEELKLFNSLESQIFDDSRKRDNSSINDQSDEYGLLVFGFDDNGLLTVVPKNYDSVAISSFLDFSKYVSKKCAANKSDMIKNRKSVNKSSHNELHERNGGIKHRLASKECNSAEGEELNLRIENVYTIPDTDNEDLSLTSDHEEISCSIEEVNSGNYILMDNEKESSSVMRKTDGVQIGLTNNEVRAQVKSALACNNENNAIQEIGNVQYELINEDENNRRIQETDDDNYVLIKCKVKDAENGKIIITNNENEMDCELKNVFGKSVVSCVGSEEINNDLREKSTFATEVEVIVVHDIDGNSDERTEIEEEKTGKLGFVSNEEQKDELRRTDNEEFGLLNDEKMLDMLMEKEMKDKSVLTSNEENTAQKTEKKLDMLMEKEIEITKSVLTSNEESNTAEKTESGEPDFVTKKADNEDDNNHKHQDIEQYAIIIKEKRVQEISDAKSAIIPSEETDVKSVEPVPLIDEEENNSAEVLDCKRCADEENSDILRDNVDPATPIENEKSILLLRNIKDRLINEEKTDVEGERLKEETKSKKKTCEGDNKTRSEKSRKKSRRNKSNGDVSKKSDIEFVLKSCAKLYELYRKKKALERKKSAIKSNRSKTNSEWLVEDIPSEDDVQSKEWLVESVSSSEDEEREKTCRSYRRIWRNHSLKRRKVEFHHLSPEQSSRKRSRLKSDVRKEHDSKRVKLE